MSEEIPIGPNKCFFCYGEYGEHDESCPNKQKTKPIIPPKDGGPAFPLSCPSTLNDGMSLRDYFAAAALTGELASSSTPYSCDATARASIEAKRSIEEHLAFNCYLIADAMLAQREKEH